MLGAVRTRALRASKQERKEKTVTSLPTFVVGAPSPASKTEACSARCDMAWPSHITNSHYLLPPALVEAPQAFSRASHHTLVANLSELHRSLGGVPVPPREQERRQARSVLSVPHPPFRVVPAPDKRVTGKARSCCVCSGESFDNQQHHLRHLPKLKTSPGLSQGK